MKSAELKTSRAWAIKESLRKFWMYRYQKCAEKYFTAWYFWATHSRIAPMIEAAKTLKRHLANILTYFKHRITNATAEGINSKIQMVKTHGLRLPEPGPLPGRDLLPLRRSRPLSSAGSHVTTRPQDVVGTHTESGSGVIFVAEAREAQSIAALADDLLDHGGDPAAIRSVSIDMSPAFIKGVTEHLPNAQITFDKFHVIAHAQPPSMKPAATSKSGDPALKGMRWVLLKDRHRLNAEQRSDLDALDRAHHHDCAPRAPGSTASSCARSSTASRSTSCAPCSSTGAPTSCAPRSSR